MNNQRVDFLRLEQSLPTQMKQAQQRYLAPMEAISIIQENPGVLPVVVSPDADHRVIWMDVGQHTFQEKKFRDSVASVAGHTDIRPFSTDIELLATDMFEVDTLPIAGLIFHMNRCGSTLLAKALARTSSHNVIIEGTSLSEGLWSYLTKKWQKPCCTSPSCIKIIRNLIRLTARRRTAEQQVAFFKLISWNTIFIKEIMQAIGDVPSLFLYRDPIEVLMSNLENRSAYLQTKGMDMGAYLTKRRPYETRDMSDMDFYLSLYEHQLTVALQSDLNYFRYLNYKYLQKQHFGEILRHAFGNTVNAEQIALMSKQFDFYSKDDSNTTRFESDSEVRQNAATPYIVAEVERRLSDLYYRLESAEQNLAHKLNFR